MVKKHISVKERPVDYKKIVNEFLDELEIGVGIQHKNLNIYPVYRSREVKTDLLSLKEALKEGILEVKETGAVAELLVINKSKDKKVLLVEGETVKGGAQHRVINTTIIIMPNTQEKIPTTCVQQNRWDTFDAPFKDTDYVSPHIHTGLVSPIYKKLDADFQTSGVYGAKGLTAYAADQGDLWSGADILLNEAGSKETTKDIHDAYETKKEDIDEWMKNFKSLFEKPIVGVIAEIDGALFADISDTVEFAKTILPQVIKGYCLDAIVSRSKKETPLDEDRIVSSLETFREGKMITGDSPNKIGKDIRIKTEKSLSNIFSYKDQIIHWVVVKA